MHRQKFKQDLYIKYLTRNLEIDKSPSMFWPTSGNRSSEGSPPNFSSSNPF